MGVVSLVMFSHRQLKNVKHLQRQAIFVTGVVPDTHQVLTHADAFTELLIRIFTSTRTKLAQRTGVTGELFAYRGTKCYKLGDRGCMFLCSPHFTHDNVESAEC